MHTQATDTRRLKIALALIVAFMCAEITVAVISSSLALLSDAAHMLTDAAALALALLAARLAARPARGAMTFGMGRAEILSANANGLTLLVLAVLIVYGAIRHLISPPQIHATPMLVVAIVGVVVNVVATRVLGEDHPGHAAAHGQAAHGHGHGHDHAPGQPDGPDLGPDHGPDHAHALPADDHASEHSHRSLNVEGSYQHLLTDLFGFLATALAAAVILLTGFRRADAIASLLIAAIMLRAALYLMRASVRVMMEAAPEGLDPEAIGRLLAAQAGVTEVHDLHVWEVTSGFPAISAHVIVDNVHDCHETRRELSELLRERFGLAHSTLQVEHAAPLLQIEVTASRPARSTP